MVTFLTKKKKIHNASCAVSWQLIELCVPQMLKDFFFFFFFWGERVSIFLIKHHKLWDHVLIVQICVILWESVQNLVLQWNNIEFQILEVKLYNLFQSSPRIVELSAVLHLNLSNKNICFVMPV